MTNDERPSARELARQAQQHVESLRAAGVEWAPLAPAPTIAQVVSSPGTGAIANVSLFDAAPPEAALPPEQRRHALEMLAMEVSRCTRCSELAAIRTQTVFGVGPIDAELCFIGEAPGADEDAQGEPFVGAAGQLLNRIIAACGMKREEVYICNILRCRPPGNRLPLPNEAANCREYLDRTLDLVRPKFLCCLGGCAAQNLLNTQLAVGKLRGQFHDYRGIPVLVTFHPAYLLRSPDRKRDVWEDMKMLLARMGRPIPRK
jgi:DNA polymerase